MKALLVRKREPEGLGKVQNSISSMRLGFVLAPQDNLKVHYPKVRWWTGDGRKLAYYNDLEDRNLFDTRVVQVEPYLLPLCPNLAYDWRICKALAETDNLDMLDLDVVKAIISVALPATTS
ncbi:unnamed protein product [Durusdinium trenchii]|uniref:Uncharacterized protein n=1 Tax=Durusdinium trenchii TaxID=1381693 RepID=A0ABP0JUD6_9DINO